MELWIMIWKACFLLAIVAFAMMSIVVIIGGAFDLRKLFRTLREDSDAESPAAERPGNAE